MTIDVSVSRASSATRACHEDDMVNIAATYPGRSLAYDMWTLQSSVCNYPELSVERGKEVVTNTGIVNNGDLETGIKIAPSTDGTRIRLLSPSLFGHRYGFHDTDYHFQCSGQYSMSRMQTP